MLRQTTEADPKPGALGKYMVAVLSLVQGLISWGSSATAEALWSRLANFQHHCICFTDGEGVQHI